MSKNDVLVTVVIPAYNPGWHLDEAIESVINQSYQAWECVVVDDGSNEDLTRVLTMDSRITIIHQENRGLPAARNAGVRAGQGSLIAFLDADDRWLPGKLEAQVAVMQTGAALSATAFYRFDKATTYPGWQPRGHHESELLRGNSICASTTMVRRDTFEALEMFDERLRSGEDWDMWIRLVRHAGPVATISEEFTAYRIHEGQMSNKTPKMWYWSLRVLVKQRGPLIPTLQGARRVGVVYGAQMFDAFRSERRPSQLAWSFAMWPDYVLREAWRQLKVRLR